MKKPHTDTMAGLTRWQEEWWEPRLSALEKRAAKLIRTVVQKAVVAEKRRLAKRG